MWVKRQGYPAFRLRPIILREIQFYVSQWRYSRWSIIDEKGCDKDMQPMGDGQNFFPEVPPWARHTLTIVHAPANFILPSQNNTVAGTSVGCALVLLIILHLDQLVSSAPTYILRFNVPNCRYFMLSSTHLQSLQLAVSSTHSSFDSQFPRSCPTPGS